MPVMDMMGQASWRLQNRDGKWNTSGHLDRIVHWRRAIEGLRPVSTMKQALRRVRGRLPALHAGAAFERASSNLLPTHAVGRYG